LPCSGTVFNDAICCRPELVALDVADLEKTEEGFKIVIRRSKTDQEGEVAGLLARIPLVTTCALRSLHSLGFTLDNTILQLPHADRPTRRPR
jgi:hypothetical protein